MYFVTVVQTILIIFSSKLDGSPVLVKRIGLIQRLETTDNGDKRKETPLMTANESNDETVVETVEHMFIHAHECSLLSSFFVPRVICRQRRTKEKKNRKKSTVKTTSIC